MIQHPLGFVYCYACVQNFRECHRPVPRFLPNVYELNVNNPMPTDTALTDLDDLADRHDAQDSHEETEPEVRDAV